MIDLDQWREYEFDALITNDGINSGNHDYRFVPGVGNAMIVLYGRIANLDGSARTITALIRTQTDVGLGFFLVVAGVSVAAGEGRNFPTSESTADNGMNTPVGPWMLSGPNRLFFRVASVAVNQDSRLTLHALVSMNAPTVLLVSPTDATETIAQDKVI